jgi:hypothetical protein
MQYLASAVNPATVRSDWFDVIGWSMFIGFVVFCILIAMIWTLIDEGKLRNPFNPWIRGRQEKRRHKMEMERLKTLAGLAAKGLDPDYVKHLERKNP